MPARGRFGAAALASLLMDAPQCVPYEQRVQVFRSLIAGLKSTCEHSPEHIVSHTVVAAFMHHELDEPHNVIAPKNCNL